MLHECVSLVVRDLAVSAHTQCDGALLKYMISIVSKCYASWCVTCPSLSTTQLESSIIEIHDSNLSIDLLHWPEH